EQAEGRRGAITTATDVYGLGAILYAALTAQPPFQADSVLATLDQVRHRAAQPPSKVNPKVDRDLEVICLKCLEKDPRRRYDSADALADDLERYLGGEPIQARPVGSWERLVKWVRRRPAAAALLIMSGVAALALVGVAVGAHYNRQLRTANREIADARQAEEQQRKLTEASLDREKLLRYFNRIVLAGREWNDHNVGRTRALLEECPPELRGW